MAFLAPAVVYFGGNAALVTGSTGLANLIGFSASGPIAGSVAALAQAFVGNVAAGSTFAAVQSMAMGGAGAATMAGAAVGVGVVAAPLVLFGGGAYALNRLRRRRDNRRDNGDGKTKNEKKVPTLESEGAPGHESGELEEGSESESEIEPMDTEESDTEDRVIVISREGSAYFHEAK